MASDSTQDDAHRYGSDRVEKHKRRLPFSPSPPHVLSIAGSDPSGGAGIQADLKTFASLGCYGMCALTSLTAQNTQGVTDIHVTPTSFFRAQLQALWADVEVDAIKIGMLGNQDIVQALSEELSCIDTKQIPVVLDPVMVSTSGSLLLTHASIKDLIERLLPRCTLLTPNLPEAEQLLAHAECARETEDAEGEGEGETRSSKALLSLMYAAKKLTGLGPRATLVKGGHHTSTRSEVEISLKELGVHIQENCSEQELFLGAQVMQGTWESHRVTVVRTDGEPYAEILQGADGGVASDAKVVTDVLYDSHGDRFALFVKPHVQSTATHGTGCTLSSALAAHLAGGDQADVMVSAVHASIQYVQRCISRGLSDLGKGAGPLNHLCTVQPRPILSPVGRGAESSPLCARLIAHSLPHWRAFTQHPFVQRLATFDLAREAFIYFLRQDYLFLKHYARVWASGASSFTVGNSFARIGTFAGIAAAMAAEADNHVKICEAWGISRHQLEHETVESAATLAYTRYVLDVSRAGDALELLAATGPCLLGYGEAGRWIANEQRRLVGSLDKSSAEAKAFQNWIDYYAGEEFQQVVRDGITNMERYAAADPPSVVRTASLQRIWDAAVRLEIGMWDEALDKSLRRDVLAP